MKLTAKKIAELTLSTQNQIVATLETPEDILVRQIKQYAKEMCFEQQKLSKEHLFDVGQTVFVTSDEEMPYPDFK